MTDETADEVREMLDRMEDVFERHGYGGDDFDAFEAYVRAMVEDGMMWPDATFTSVYDLSLKDRFRGKRDVDVGRWLSMGVMLGTAMERDVPADSELEELYRDGEVVLPETAVSTTETEGSDR